MWTHYLDLRQLLASLPGSYPLTANMYMELPERTIEREEGLQHPLNFGGEVNPPCVNDSEAVLITTTAV